MQLKRPEMMSQQWFFDWDNARVHTAAVVFSWFDAHGVQRQEHAPWNARAWTRTASRMPGRGSSPLIAVAFATAFRSLVARCKKRVRLGGKFVEKS